MNTVDQETKKIEDFFSQLRFRLEVFKTAQGKLDIHLARDFNVFKYISPDENRLSDIIADLLDPEGKHGQGSVFLTEFLKVTESSQKCPPGVSPKVKREAATDYADEYRRRIDITIDLGDFGIGIENKPWVEDHEKQIDSYREHLGKRYKDNYLLAYLSGDGRGPQRIEKAEVEPLQRQGKLKVLAYSAHFRNWLEICYKECKAEKVRQFLGDFISYVDDNFVLRSQNLTE